MPLMAIRVMTSCDFEKSAGGKAQLAKASNPIEHVTIQSGSLGRMIPIRMDAAASMAKAG